jgi:hypothetical protein
MKQDVIYGDLEDIVLDDIYETYPQVWDQIKEQT